MNRPRLQIFLLALLLCSCVTKEGFERITTKHYTALNSAAHPKTEIDLVFIERKNTSGQAAYCECERKKYLLIPLGVFNYLERKFDCVVDQRFYEDMLLNEMNEHLSRYFRSGTDPQVRISLSFKRVPNSYKAHFKGHFFIIPFPPFIFGLRGGKQKLSAPADSLILNYDIYNLKNRDTANLAQHGTLSTVCPSLLLKRERDVNRKQFVIDYLNSWDVNMRHLNRKLAIELLNKMKLEELRQE